MNGLTPDRVARAGAWRNSRRSSKGAGSAAESFRDHGEGRSSFHTTPPEALGRAVELEVIPRLMVAHRLPAAEAAPALAFPTRPDVQEFSALIVSARASVVWAWVSTRIADNPSVQALCVDLLIPAANLVSQRWQADRCQFEEVALGMLNLQHVLHSLTCEEMFDAASAPAGKKILLLSAPCEQNMLGIFMVTEFHRCVTTEFFYRAGWDVWRAPPPSRPQLLDVLHSQWFDVIDVASTCADRMPQLTEDIAQLRLESRNATVGMTVSGPAFANHPELAVRVGADACACDPRDTLAQAESISATTLREGSGFHGGR